MKQVTLSIQDSKYQLFLEFVKNLNFVHIDSKGDSKDEVFANLKEGFKEMKGYKEGRLEGTSLQNFLNEL